MKRILFVVLLATLVLSASPVWAGSLLESMLPWLFSSNEHDTNSGDVTIAPFAVDPRARPEGEASESVYSETLEQDLPLNVRHRSLIEMARWIETMAGEAMTFSREHSADEYQSIQKYFSAQGLQNYKDFLSSSGVLGLMSSGDQTFRTSGIVLEFPDFQGSGVDEGAYYWKFSLLTSLTFYEAGKEDLEGYVAPVRFYEILVTISRSEYGVGKHKVLISSWKASEIRPDVAREKLNIYSRE